MQLDKLRQRHERMSWVAVHLRRSRLVTEDERVGRGAVDRLRQAKIEHSLYPLSRKMSQTQLNPAKNYRDGSQ